MLQFLLGAARSGKTAALHQRIEALSREENRRIFLLVPEQFTFETEKALYRRLGGERFKRVSVTSFTRLAAEAFRRYGGIAGRYADDCAKCVLMELALDELRDGLEVYARSLKGRGFSGLMLETVSELKNAGVDPGALYARAQLLPEPALRKKAAETALIYETYESLLKRSYLDPLDDVTRAEKILRETDFFDGAVVFFDEFKGFTANENGMIRLILSRAEQVVVSLCMDPERPGGEASVFASVREVRRKLTRFARQLNVRVLTPEVLTESYFDAPELAHLEQNLMSPAPRSYPGENQAVQAVLCRNEYEEVDYVLSSIALLVREAGYSYDDIAILTRDLPTYRAKLEAGARRYRGQAPDPLCGERSGLRPPGVYHGKRGGSPEMRGDSLLPGGGGCPGKLRLRLGNQRPAVAGVLYRQSQRLPGAVHPGGRGCAGAGEPAPGVCGSPAGAVPGDGKERLRPGDLRGDYDPPGTDAGP